MKCFRCPGLMISLAYASILCIPTLTSGDTGDSSELPRPNPAIFQSGDFVWPKRPGAYVPYNAGSANSPELDKEQWNKERDIYLQKYQDSPMADKVLRQRLDTLRAMDFREFIATYAGGQEAGVPGVYSGGGLYVGHVGIIEVDSKNVPWVIEALLNQGVVRTRYSDWIKQRSDQVVWLGRIRQLSAEQRSKVAAEAKHYLGRPYDFWNFDLNDDSGFYCSKLAWLSIHRSLGFAIDGKNDPNRFIWFSPKQFLYLPTIERIHDPGPYAK
ncbi:MAG: hypothetical protein H8K04_12405 [Nitrospira sp.]